MKVLSLLFILSISLILLLILWNPQADWQAVGNGSRVNKDGSIEKVNLYYDKSKTVRKADGLVSTSVLYEWTPSLAVFSHHIVMRKRTIEPKTVATKTQKFYRSTVQDVDFDCRHETATQRYIAYYSEFGGGGEKLESYDNDEHDSEHQKKYGVPLNEPIPIKADDHLELIYEVLCGK